MGKQSGFPPGWDEERVRRVLARYESQTEEEAVAQDEAAFERSRETVMDIPKELVPAVRELIAKHSQERKLSWGGVPQRGHLRFARSMKEGRRSRAGSRQLGARDRA